MPGGRSPTGALKRTGAHGCARGRASHGPYGRGEFSLLKQAKLGGAHSTCARAYSLLFASYMGRYGAGSTAPKGSVRGNATINGCILGKGLKN